MNTPSRGSGTTGNTATSSIGSGPALKSYSSTVAASRLASQSKTETQPSVARHSSGTKKSANPRYPRSGYGDPNEGSQLPRKMAALDVAAAIIRPAPSRIEPSKDR